MQLTANDNCSKKRDYVCGGGGKLVTVCPFISFQFFTRYVHDTCFLKIEVEM